MPSRRNRNDLVLFSSQDPQPLVNWLCESFGISTVLQAVAQFRPSGATEEAPTKRASKRRAGKKGGSKKGGSKKGGKRGRPKGSRNKQTAGGEGQQG